MSTSSTIQLIYDITQEAVRRDTAHLSTEGKTIQNNQIRIKGQEVLSFSSCSYLGLEQDSRLKDAAKAAIDNFGTQFSSSRAYISLGLYEELEHLLGNVFGCKTIVSPTTTLGHIAALPVLVSDDDAVILDHQVHHSVQTASGLLRSRRIHVEMIRHNNMAMLEERVKHLAARHKKVWYLADGVYSMYGDLCPVADIRSLLERYEQFHFYVDDAHGMSYMGPHGSGYIRQEMPELHPRMVLATSLNKAFATGGGAIIIPDEALQKRVRACGSTFITSGPLQPANLGAGIASAQLHLTDEITDMQDDLQDKLRYTRMMATQLGLPLISPSPTAIVFIGLGAPKLGYALVQRMMQRGYLVNLGIFPAVPIRNTGIRFTVTRMHTYAQITEMMETLKEQFDIVLKEEDTTLPQIYKAFGMKTPEEIQAAAFSENILRQVLALTSTHYTTILDIDKNEWNRMYEGRGAFDWNGLATLEHIFKDNKLPEDNWDWNYVIIRDQAGMPVAATFTTTALWKDDIQSPADVSRKIEELRKNDAYYLVSKVTAAGTLITEGEHVYINKQSPLWKDGLRSLLKELHQITEIQGTETLFVRDMIALDDETTTLISDEGFFKTEMPAMHVHDASQWKDVDSFYQLLSRKNKDHFNRDNRRNADEYELIPVSNPNEAQVAQWYGMYQQVKNRNLDLNTFPLPVRFFRESLANPAWEACELRHKASNEVLAVGFCYKSGNTYIPTVIGIDYARLDEHKAYKRMLFQVMLRAKSLHCTSVHLGFGASQEKRKLNAKSVNAFAFIQAKDNFNAEFLQHLNIVSNHS